MLREEEGFILRLVYLWGFLEVESDNALKLAKEGLLDKILRLVIVSVVVNEALVL